MSAGLFLSVEGIDGSGKTTQLDLLTQRLEAEGVAFLLNREPGGSPVGRKIRQILLDPKNHVSPTAELLLYFANRAQNVDEWIRPALAAGKMVVSDRYTDSTIAYQGSARNLGVDLVQRLHRTACRGTEPALTIYLRITPELSARRLKRQAKDRLEAEAASFHQEVFNAYESLAAAHPDRIVTVDGARRPAVVAKEIWNIVEERWRRRDQ